jgi:hypothetical protein
MPITANSLLDNRQRRGAGRKVAELRLQRENQGWGRRAKIRQAIFSQCRIPIDEDTA